MINAGIAAGLIGAYRMGPEAPGAERGRSRASGCGRSRSPRDPGGKEWVGAPEEPTSPITLVDWEEAGERWELPKRGIYPIWQMIHPNVQIEIQATPIGEMFPKISWPWPRSPTSTTSSTTTTRSSRSSSPAGI